MSTPSATRIPRRALLKGLCAAPIASALWPRGARAAGGAAVKRVLIINAHGGVRWSASFDGQAKAAFNPWGVVPTRIYAPPADGWGLSRMFLQKPLWMNATDWAGTIYPYLSNDTSYNLTHPTLTKNAEWNGASLKSFAELAPQIAVVRISNNPGGPTNLDHAAAQRMLHTGYGNGAVGMVTALQHALKQQLGAAFTTQYPLPAVQVEGPGRSAWSNGVGPYASSRPLVLADPLTLPTLNPGNSVAPWGRDAEGDVDAALAGARQAVPSQLVADFINDKAGADAHVGQLVDPALHLGVANNDSATLGTLLDGTTRVTNRMLAEAFGLSSAMTPSGDILFDAFGAAKCTSLPSWGLNENTLGLVGALAVRLFQTGAPVVAAVAGVFDTHSFEVLDPSHGHPHPVEMIKLSRTLTALEFVLKNVADPQEPGRDLWSSTVVLIVSEFGRNEPSWVAPTGFNDPNGANDGGTGHHPWSACVMMGGPVTAGGKLVTSGSPTDTIMMGTADQMSGFFHQNRIFTSVMKAMGIEDANNTYLPYGSFAPIPGLLTGA